MSQQQKGMGIKLTLQKLDIDILEINKQISQNALLYITLKNQQAKLQTIFNNRVQQTGRNIKIDVEKFQQEMNRNFNNHNNFKKMLQKKLEEIQDSQQQLATNLYYIQEKVKEMESALG